MQKTTYICSIHNKQRLQYRKYYTIPIINQNQKTTKKLRKMKSSIKIIDMDSSHKICVTLPNGKTVDIFVHKDDYERVDSYYQTILIKSESESSISVDGREVRITSK